MNYLIIYSFENWKHQYIVYLIGNVWFCDEIVVISERKRCTKTSEDSQGSIRSLTGRLVLSTMTRRNTVDVRVITL